MSLRGSLESLALYLFHALFVRPTLKLVVGVRYRRRANVPAGACIVVANHNSHLDAPVLLSLFPLRRLRSVHPVAAADYFGETFLRRLMSMVLMNAVPVKRKPTAGQDPLAQVVAALEGGESIILFPEGTRGEAGVVTAFRSGVGRIVRSMPAVPVVPVFLSGPERIWPRGEAVPIPLGIDVHVGRPRTYDPSKEPREIAEEIRKDVLALAPPLSSAPGPRPPRPTMTAIYGGSAEQRRAVTLALGTILADDDELGALALTDRLLEVRSDGVEDAETRIPPRRGVHALLARMAGAPRPFDGANFAELVRRARAEQGLVHDPEHRSAVIDGSALLDVLASAPGVLTDDRAAYQRLQYAEAQRRLKLTDWTAVGRADPVVWLLNALSLARLHAPAVLVLLTPDDSVRAVAALLRRTRKVEVLEFPREAAVSEIAATAARVCRATQSAAHPAS